MMDNRAQVIALAQQGIPPRDIVDVVPLSRQTIYEYIRHARLDGTDIPVFRGGRPKKGCSGRSFYLSVRAVERLAPHAEARGVDVKSLVQDLLAAIARDDLVDAVLDDKSTPQPKSGDHHA